MDMFAILALTFMGVGIASVLWGLVSDIRGKRHGEELMRLGCGVMFIGIAMAFMVGDRYQMVAFAGTPVVPIVAIGLTVCGVITMLTSGHKARR